MAEDESEIRKLKMSMEAWRELILSANSILLWEKPWHPTALLTGSTILFTLLWLFDPNILTVLSLIGLLITVGDYVLPMLLQSLFKSEKWTTDKQKEFELICTNLVILRTKAELLFSSYCRMRVTNTKMYFSVTILGLCFLTWLGGTIDNLLLTYVFVTFVLLLPGMHKNGMLNRCTETLAKIFNDLVENAKSKVSQKKTQ